MFAVGLHPASEAEHLSLRAPVGSGDADHDVLTLGEGAGLVEQHGTNAATGLEGETVLDQDPVARGHGTRQRGREWDGKPQGVRTRDHQHRHDPHDGLVSLTEQRPHDGRDDRSAHRHVEQERRGPVGQHLRTRPRFLGLGHQASDPGQRRVLTDRGDLDPHR